MSGVALECFDRLNVNCWSYGCDTLIRSNLIRLRQVKLHLFWEGHIMPRKVSVSDALIPYYWFQGFSQTITIRLPLLPSLRSRLEETIELAAKEWRMTSESRSWHFTVDAHNFSGIFGRICMSTHVKCKTGYSNLHFESSIPSSNKQQSGFLVKPRC